MKTGFKIILVVLGAVLITGGSIALTSLSGSGQSVFAPIGSSSEPESEESSFIAVIAPASEQSVPEPSSEPEPSAESVEPESSKESSKTSSKKTSSKASSAASQASQVTTSIAEVSSTPSTVSEMTKEELWASKMAILNDWEQFQKMLDDPDNDFWDDEEFWMGEDQMYLNPESYYASSNSTSSRATSVPTYPDSERLEVMKTDKVTTRYGTKLTTDTYYNTVLRIIGAELSPSYSDECIKAQMVASYTFLRYHAGYTDLPPTAILDDLDDMKAYWKDEGMQRLYNLLAEVGGYMLFIDNHPILSTYGAINNGTTNNIVDVWGGSGIDGYGTPYTYLAGGIDCPWDRLAKGYASQVILSSSIVKEQLENYFGVTLGNDPSKWIVIKSYNAFGYVMNVSIDSKVNTTGKDLRGYVFTSSHVGSKNCLRSTSFTVQYDAATDSFYFDVQGYGHGVGMSQEGAQQMALAGYTWQDIVKFYYPGITIV